MTTCFANESYAVVHNLKSNAFRRCYGTELELTTGESRLLSVLLDNPFKILDRSKLLDLVAGREPKAYDRAIDNTVSRLRKKIERDPKSPELIVTKWGGGYMLACDVETLL